MKPAISIIVPVYNVEPYLEDCLNSILNQTFTDFEVILVNDGSTDQSGSICDFYNEKDSRVKVIHKSYAGVSSARNAGVNKASGKYIGFVDGDDRIKENMYQTLYDLCTFTNSDIAISRLGREINGQLINENETAFVKELTNNQAMKELFRGVLYRFSLCNKLFHSKCFKGVIFPNGRIHEDLATTYRLFSKSNKCIYTNEIGYVYVKRENSILTSNYSEKRLDSFKGWDEILSFMKQRYPEIFPQVVSCFIYWSVDQVYYVLNQITNKKEKLINLNKIQFFISKHSKDLSWAKGISFKPTLVIKLLSLNLPYLLYLINSNQYLVHLKAKIIKK